MSVELVLCRLDTRRRSWLDVLRSWRICKEMMLYIIVRRRGELYLIRVPAVYCAHDEKKVGKLFSTPAQNIN